MKDLCGDTNNLFSICMIWLSKGAQNLVIGAKVTIAAMGN